MLTLEKLRELGANTEEGMARCRNNEEFYLKLVGMALADDSFEKLAEAVEKKDLDEAFERAHALKGVLGNVSLTSLAEPVVEVTEELRARKDIDYSPYIEKMNDLLAKFRELANG